MSKATVNQSFLLDAGRMLCIRDGAGILIYVRDGCGVLTQENDWDDIVLEKGSTFALQNHGKAILIGRKQTGLRLTLVVSSTCRARIEIKEYLGQRPLLITTLKTASRGGVVNRFRDYLIRMMRIAYDAALNARFVPEKQVR